MGSGGQRQLEKASWRKENGRNRTLREGLQRVMPQGEEGGQCIWAPGWPYWSQVTWWGRGGAWRREGAPGGLQGLGDQGGQQEGTRSSADLLGKVLRCFFFPMPDGVSPAAGRCAGRCPYGDERVAPRLPRARSVRSDRHSTNRIVLVGLSLQRKGARRGV